MDSRCVDRRAQPRGLAFVLAFAISMVSFVVSAHRVRAQDEDESQGAAFSGIPLGVDPFGADVRVHYYELLKRSPGKAFLLDLALPGAGSVYTHLWGNTIVAATLSAVGAGLWIAGAVRERDDLWWAGAGTFAVGRVYGLVSAPLGAVLLNAAYRRHLGLVLQRQP